MMMIRSICVLAIGFCLSVASTAAADVVAYWNFNSFDPGTGTTIVADQGSGTISLVDWGGSVDNFGGDTLNALNGDPDGQSLSLVGDIGNGTYIDLSFSMAGMQGLDVSYWTRRTNTGFTSNQWSYSNDGMNFADFGSAIDPVNNSNGGVVIFELSALDNVDTAYLRYTLDGATGGSGNNRIDNLVLNATAIPEPSSLALLGLAGIGLVAIRRRRGPAASSAE